jgi:hypothetical protein
LGSWHHFVGRLDSLWRYLSHQWLRHGRRQEDDRQAVSSVWAQLQRAWCAGEREPINLHRPAVEAARVIVVPQLAGLLATAAAQVQVLAEQTAPAPYPAPSHPQAPLPYWRLLLAAVRAAHHYTEAKEEHLEAKSATRAEALRRRGGSLKGTPQACRSRGVASARLITSKQRARWWEGARWKSVEPVYVPGQGLMGGLVELTPAEVGT